MPLEKRYNVIATESYMINFEFMAAQFADYGDALRVIDYNDFDVDALPQLDMVMASFVLPFYHPEDFLTLWNSLDKKIKVGSYFVGNFFDPQWNIVSDELRKNMTFHTKQEVLKLFENYEILKFEEVRKQSSKPIGNDYYYEVFARKIK